MAKQIVGAFKTDFSGIEFYDIVDNWNEFTILKHQLSGKYYAWNNKFSMLSEDMHIIDIPEDKNKYEELIPFKPGFSWCLDMVFFWADSKFVTDYGLPGYEKLIELYKNLISIRHQDFELDNELANIRVNQGLFSFYMASLRLWWMKKDQRRMLRKIEKEYKIIW